MSKKEDQDTGFIDVFTDGSCNFRKRKLGIGIVVSITNPRKIIFFSKTIIPDEKLDLNEYGPLTAEFAAATYTLNELPANSNVRIHTDHPILRKVLNRHLDGKPLLWKPRVRRTHSAEFKKLVSNLKKGIARHATTIEVIRANDITHEHMQLAHEAAAKGSGAKGIKPRNRIIPNKDSKKNDPQP